MAGLYAGQDQKAAEHEIGPATALVDRLNELSILQGEEILGCIRRGRLGETWRSRGTLYLSHVGKKIAVPAPSLSGILELFVDPTSGMLLQFRAGKWRSFWEEDAILSWAYLKVANSETPRSIIYLVENTGSLSGRCLKVDDRIDPAEVVAQRAEQLVEVPHHRLDPHSRRSYIVCPHCPVRVQCEAMDAGRRIGDPTFKERGEMSLPT